MDVPKINNNYKLPENSSPRISASKDENGRGNAFTHTYEETAAEEEENVNNVFLNSYLKETDTFAVSTIEWLGTWRPLIN